MTRTVYRPGQKCPISGQYGIVNRLGTYLGKERTCVRGEPFPPISQISTPGGVGYVLRDATRH